jgi:hypothetical protein
MIPVRRDDAFSGPRLSDPTILAFGNDLLSIAAEFACR